MSWYMLEWLEQMAYNLQAHFDLKVPLHSVSDMSFRAVEMAQTVSFILSVRDQCQHCNWFGQIEVPLVQSAHKIGIYLEQP